MGDKVRKWMRHGRPSWVDPQLPIFITFCTRPRGMNQIANTRVWSLLLDARTVLTTVGKMNPIILLAMTDHVHLLARISSEVSVKTLVRSLKTAVSYDNKVDWQPGFFDHRVRSKKQLNEIIDYIRMNPVRAGLCGKVEDWPYSWQKQDGSQDR